MKVQLIMKVDKWRLEQVMSKSIEDFKRLEANCLKEVDLEQCLKDFIDVAFICHNITYVDAVYK